MNKKTLNSVWAAFEGTSSFMEGYNELLLGLFTTKEKALSALKKQPRFKETQYSKEKNLWNYQLDGELTIFYYIKKLEVK